MLTTTTNPAKTRGRAEAKPFSRVLCIAVSHWRQKAHHHVSISPDSSHHSTHFQAPERHEHLIQIAHENLWSFPLTNIHRGFEKSSLQCIMHTFQLMQQTLHHWTVERTQMILNKSLPHYWRRLHQSRPQLRTECHVKRGEVEADSLRFYTAAVATSFTKK